MDKNNSKLGIFGIAMISIAGVFSIRSLPSMAEYGSTLITYYVLAAIVYFVPSALICAELSSSWPKDGGLYAWVKEAFGHRAGFLTVWLEWTNTVVAFPAMLSFGVAAIAYLIDPQLVHNKVDIFFIMLAFLWSSTLLNILGVRASLWVSSLSTIAGMVLPAVLIIVLGVLWILLGKPSHLNFAPAHLKPNLHWNNAAFLSGMLLSYAGMQVTGFHAKDINNPQRNYSRGIFIAGILILFLYIFGALAVGIVVPQQQISLVAGIFQVMQTFFTTFHLHWLMPLIAGLILVGFFANLNTWIISPSRGLSTSAKFGGLPKAFAKLNKREAPSNILLLQAIIGSVLASVFLFMPTVSSSYWLLTVLTAQLTFLMDILLFAAVIRLRYSQPKTTRHYRIPGGMTGIWIIGGVAIVMCVFGFVVGFAPPQELKTGSQWFYDGFLAIGLIAFILPAFWMTGKKLQIKS
jgi:glutamate:GABA antiporter